MINMTILKILQKQFEVVAKTRKVEFKDKETLDACIEYYVEMEDMENGFDSIEHYMDQTIELYKTDIFKTDEKEKIENRIEELIDKTNGLVYMDLLSEEELKELNELQEKLEEMED